ncbi:MAG: 50S ribosomal protein L3 [Cyanobacteria bacterium REEB459]|nr:50S ribosomal protein L3 [Cyanobacteria bacterium REEB459]
MALGILGKKLGMTQIFDQTGRAIPVTVIQAGPCVVTQVKTPDTDGYGAIQVGFEETTEKSLNRPKLGHLNRSGSAPLRYLKEYRVEVATEYELGQSITADTFTVGQLVDVRGKSIGRGFAGYQKRHNFRRGPMAHGSKNHRLPGSTGAGTTPGRVYPGKRMAGHLGDSQVTIRKLEVVQVDSDRHLLLIKGAIPGKPGGLVSITPAKWVKA